MNPPAATIAWKSAWITGASTGIGRAVALDLAHRGVRVAISARSTEKLADVARLHANLTSVPLDVTDRGGVEAAARGLVERFGLPDLAILNAGVWHPMRASEYDGKRAIHSMEVNYFGITNVLEQLIPAMIARGHGHLALVASVAGYRGLPMASAYAPSKAAVISLAEVLRLELSRHGIVVSLVNPGFVETPMTAVNEFPMPFMIKPEDAARRIVRGLEKKHFEIAFPWQLVAMLKVLRIMPNWLYLRVGPKFGAE